MPRQPAHAPRHRRGVTRTALVTITTVLGAITLVQVAGAARFAEAALTGRPTSWLLATVALVGGGLSAAFAIVKVQALVLDLRTRRPRTRQDASCDPRSPDPSASVPTQRPGTAAPATPAGARGRGGVHRAGPA